jgi:hypothetical protein
MSTETHVIESCLPCQIKIRVLKDKVESARCPKCKGPLGDPPVDHLCSGCGARNRVPRSKLAVARCGRCKTQLLPTTDTPPAPAAPASVGHPDADDVVSRIFADPRLAGRQARPRDLVETVDLLRTMPQRIAEIAAQLPTGADREALSALSARSRDLVGTLRPLAFANPDRLFTANFLDQFQLKDAYEAMRHHPHGWDTLKAIRKADTGLGAARLELAPTAALFEQILNRVHKTDWNDMDGDRLRRTELAGQLCAELTRAVESWLPRPYKLEAMVKVAMTRIGELPGGAEAIAKSEATLKDDVTAFLAIATTVVARGVTQHGLGASPKEAWAALQGVLRGAALATS